MKCSNEEVLGPGVCFSFLAQLCVNHRLWNSYLLSSLAGFLEWTSGNRHVVFLSLALYCAALLRQREILCHKTNTPLLNSANTSDHNSLSIFLSFLPSLCTCFLFQYHHFSMETTACRSCDTVCVWIKSCDWVLNKELKKNTPLGNWLPSTACRELRFSSLTRCSCYQFQCEFLFSVSPVKSFIPQTNIFK